MARLIVTCTAAASLLAGALALQGCGACSAVGCGPVQIARLDLASVQPQDTVSACRNGACVTGPLPTPTPTAGVGIQVALTGAGADNTRATLWTRADGTLQLQVEWSRSAEAPRDGDVYAVTVSSGAGGAALASTRGIATYSNVSAGPDSCRSCTVATPIGDAP